MNEHQRTITLDTSESFLRAFDPICVQLGCSRAELIQYVLDRWTRSVLNEPRILSTVALGSTVSARF